MNSNHSFLGHPYSDKRINQQSSLDYMNPNRPFPNHSSLDYQLSNRTFPNYPLSNHSLSSYSSIYIASLCVARVNNEIRKVLSEIGSRSSLILQLPKSEDMDKIDRLIFSIFSKKPDTLVRRVQCQAITKKGKQCLKVPKGGSYCPIHIISKIDHENLSINLSAAPSPTVAPSPIVRTDREDSSDSSMVTSFPLIAPSPTVAPSPIIETNHKLQRLSISSSSTLFTESSIQDMDKNLFASTYPIIPKGKEVTNKEMNYLNSDHRYLFKHSVIDGHLSRKDLDSIVRDSGTIAYFDDTKGTIKMIHLDMLGYIKLSDEKREYMEFDENNKYLGDIYF